MTQAQVDKLFDKLDRITQLLEKLCNQPVKLPPFNPPTTVPLKLTDPWPPREAPIRPTYGDPPIYSARYGGQVGSSTTAR